MWSVKAWEGGLDVLVFHAVLLYFCVRAFWY